MHQLKMRKDRTLLSSGTLASHVPTVLTLQSVIICISTSQRFLQIHANLLNHADRYVRLVLLILKRQLERSWYVFEGRMPE